MVRSCPAVMVHRIRRRARMIRPALNPPVPTIRRPRNPMTRIRSARKRRPAAIRLRRNRTAATIRLLPNRTAATKRPLANRIAPTTRRAPSPPAPNPGPIDLPVRMRVRGRACRTPTSPPVRLRNLRFRPNPRLLSTPVTAMGRCRREVNRLHHRTAPPTRRTHRLPKPVPPRSRTRTPVRTRQPIRARESIRSPRPAGRAPSQRDRTRTIRRRIRPGPSQPPPASRAHTTVEPNPAAKRPLRIRAARLPSRNRTRHCRPIPRVSRQGIRTRHPRPIGTRTPTPGRSKQARSRRSAPDRPCRAHPAQPPAAKTLPPRQLSIPAPRRPRRLPPRSPRTPRRQPESAVPILPPASLRTRTSARLPQRNPVPGPHRATPPRRHAGRLIHGSLGNHVRAIPVRRAIARRIRKVGAPAPSIYLPAPPRLRACSPVRGGLERRSTTRGGYPRISPPTMRSVTPHRVSPQ